jgi:chromosome segregation ATPase
MKIRDAQEMYRAQIRDYNSEMSAVSKRRKEIQNALKNASGADKDTLDKEAATIELTYKALQDKQNEYYDYMNDLTEQWCMWANAESAKQQGEAMKDYYRDMPLRYNNDKQKKPLFSRGLSVCRLLFNSFSKLKIDENYKEKRRLFY